MGVVMGARRQGQGGGGGKCPSPWKIERGGKYA